ncbi:MAG: hypothetical protein Q8Q12_04370 [bacterium]|nr:hypothetical protein [bacterium]
MKSLIFTVAVVCLSVCLSISSPTLAATRYVDGSVSASGDGTSWQTAFKAIQEGIDAASDSDTVLVAEGTYIENIRFNGKNIILTSTNPLDSTIVANTIIDGNQSGSVITFSGTEDETCILSGFTIRNGKGHLGGGICGCPSQQQTHATIRNNVVSANSAESGGGLYGCDGTIRNNVIAHNSASYGGGIRYCQRGVIQNNTIVGNSALYSPGGLEWCHGIRDCIIWGNVGRAELDVNAIPNYSCVRGWTGKGEGNISLDPHFVDPDNGDYHLRSWSPCIDAGDPSSPFSNEPEPNGARVDMGAYGNTPEATSKSPDGDGDQLPDDWERTFFGDLAQNADGDPDGDGIPNIGEYRGGFSPVSKPSTWYVKAAVVASGDGRSWDTAFKTVQEGIDASSDGEIVLVAQGTYVENIQFKGKNIVLASTNPLNPTVVGNTVIDGNQAASVVAFSGSENETCVLKGFTIRNGKSSLGGGIVGGDWGGQTHATIRNSVLTSNSAADGGGVAYCGGLIEATTVTDNSATGATYGQRFRRF